MNKKDKYLKTCKIPMDRWRGINSYNQANGMTAQEAERILVIVNEYLEDLARKQLTKYRELKAPKIIMDNAEKKLEQVLAGKHQCQRNLKRRIRDK